MNSSYKFRIDPLRINIDQTEDILDLIKDEYLEKPGKLNEVDKYDTKLVDRMVFKDLMRLILMGQKQA